MTVHLTIENGATPVVRCTRTLPEARKDAVKAELQHLVDESIIVPIDEPTDSVSQMSVAEKKAGIHICIDSRPLNEVLNREHYKLPVLDDVLPELTSACKFSVCDLKSGYLHCELDHESTLLTTFDVLIFQKRLHQALEGLEGVRCIADDVIVWGRSNEEHDARVSLFLQRFSEIGISLNKEKCHFGVKSRSWAM